MTDTECDLKLIQLIIDRASFGCFCIGEDARLVYVNDFACRSLGYSREELLTMTMSDFSPRYAPDAWPALWQDLQKKGKQSLRTIHRRKDGSRFPVEMTLNYIAFEGKPYVCAYAQDLTDLMQALEALGEGEDRLRQAIRVAQVGIFHRDHLSGTVYWSPEMRKIHDKCPDDTLSVEAFLNGVHPDDREKVASAIERARAPHSDGLCDMTYRYVCKDGSVRYISMRSQTSFDGKGDTRQPVRTVGAVRDITGRRQAEKERENLQSQLHQAQKMEAVGQLAGGVAHDFNNMLQTILGYSEIALEISKEGGKLREYLSEITRTARRSADLTRQLLAFARRQPIKPRVLDLNETINGLLKMLRRLIGENIELIWKPGFEIWPVKMDPSQVDQILVNLSVNARDAIMNVGMLTIETFNVIIDETYCHTHAGFIPGAYVLLAVSDNGAGMEQETLSRLFEPFFTTKERGKGTGLGLATVYGIVKQNQGFINIYSEPERGSTFKVYLPREQTDISTEVISDEQLVIHGFETLLLVEDDSAILNLAKGILEHQGYTVLAAQTPGSALTLLEQHDAPVHLLITDVVMPEMNGKDLQKKITALAPGIKTLFMSGYTADVIVHHGILDTEIHFLQKPFSIRTLMRKVREVLDADEGRD
jgi:PAS domain S-box-containing protein